MEYLKEFIIGTSGLVIFPLLTNYSNYSKYNYDVKISFIIPIYYGFMCVLSIFIKNKFKISHQLSLLIISILSCIVILIVNHVLIDKYYIKNKSKKHKTIFYIIQDIMRELITFNLIISGLSTLFDKYDFMKIFIIGSSLFSYYLDYNSVSKCAISPAGSDSKKSVVNYDYKDFAITEPFVHGFPLIIGLYIGVKILKLNLVTSMILYQIISSFIMTLIAKSTRMYILSDRDWIYKYFLKLTIMTIIRGIILLVLINIFVDKNKLFN